MLITFVGTLAVGAVAGYALEQQYGMKMLRWYRQQMMRARVARRLEEGDSPLRRWND